MKAISSISALASIIGFLIPYFSNGASYTSAFQFSCLLVFSAASIVIIWNSVKEGAKRYKSETDINNYMYNWISNIGRIAIFTRDMSWTNDSQIKARLIEKAEKSELIVCMPIANDFAQELRQKGALILEYSNLGYEPQSRFTIVQFGRNDARIAIGKTIKGTHKIEEFDSADHPLFFVANDLVNILLRLNGHNGEV